MADATLSSSSVPAGPSSPSTSAQASPPPPASSLPSPPSSSSQQQQQSSSSPSLPPVSSLPSGGGGGDSSSAPDTNTQQPPTAGTGLASTDPATSLPTNAPSLTATLTATTGNSAITRVQTTTVEETLVPNIPSSLSSSTSTTLVSLPTDQPTLSGPTLGAPPTTGVSSQSNDAGDSNSNSRLVAVLAGTGAGIAALIIGGVLLCWYFHRRTERRERRKASSEEAVKKANIAFYGRQSPAQPFAADGRISPMGALKRPRREDQLEENRGSGDSHQASPAPLLRGSGTLQRAESDASSTAVSKIGPSTPMRQLSPTPNELQHPRSSSSNDSAPPFAEGSSVSGSPGAAPAEFLSSTADAPVNGATSMPIADWHLQAYQNQILYGGNQDAALYMPVSTDTGGGVPSHNGVMGQPLSYQDHPAYQQAFADYYNYYAAHFASVAAQQQQQSPVLVGTYPTSPQPFGGYTAVPSSTSNESDGANSKGKGRSMA
ncbi:hypothetical protein DFJ73DRAFT_794857 [Zopfochytrium polystomum]|nr:hypothetical protein DFJ73DRAFT_794857 [Zopfochytrium polystomum]